MDCETIKQSICCIGKEQQNLRLGCKGNTDGGTDYFFVDNDYTISFFPFLVAKCLKSSSRLNIQLHMVRGLFYGISRL